MKDNNGLMLFLGENQSKTLNQHLAMPRYDFDALVKYHHRGICENFSANVKADVSGYCGTLRIIPHKKEIVDDGLHLEFKDAERCQKFTYNERSNSLQITGKSSEIGAYKIEIHL